ncbi:MAG TPA: DUF2267 domain-containing protein [Alphaproteobacteria bacterium]|nr:DUF2267 domain-containing protein [Alphaproteobacteria bacterium]
MSATGLEVFDRTLQDTNIWLDEIMQVIGPDRKRAFHVLRAVLHSLRDRLTVEEATHLSAQLPLLIRGVYFEGWRPSSTPRRERTQEEFLNIVGEQMHGIRPASPMEGARAVFSVLSKHVSAGEIAQVKAMLPKPIASLWP